MEIVTSIHENTGAVVIEEVPNNYRLLRKRTQCNGYGLYYDLFGNTWHISSEAEKVPRLLWTGCIVGEDYHIYVNNEYTEEDIDGYRGEYR